MGNLWRLECVEIQHGDSKKRTIKNARSALQQITHHMFDEEKIPVVHIFFRL